MNHLTQLEAIEDNQKFRQSLPRLIPIKEVMIITGLARSTIYKKISEGSFPNSVKLSAGCVRWKDIDLMNWMNSLNQ